MDAVLVRHSANQGVVAGVLGCIAGVLGIFTLGVIFVPLATICSVVGMVRALIGASAAGFGCSLFAGVLAIWGFVFSPSLWVLLGAGIAATQLPAVKVPSAAPTATQVAPSSASISPRAPLAGANPPAFHPSTQPGLTPATQGRVNTVPETNIQTEIATCAFVGGQQRCHTLDQWDQMARLWCDRYQTVKARREQEQALGWGTNGMYGSPQGAEFTRDIQLESDALSTCTGEKFGLTAAQQQASKRMAQ